MSDVYTIMITGILSQIGHNGGVKFQVCVNGKAVDPDFSRSPYDDGGWLLLDQSVFETAQAIFLSSKTATTKARLLLSPGGSDTTTLYVDDVPRIWIEPAS